MCSSRCAFHSQQRKRVETFHFQHTSPPHRPPLPSHPILFYPPLPSVAVALSSVTSSWGGDATAAVVPTNTVTPCRRKHVSGSRHLPPPPTVPPRLPLTSPGGFSRCVCLCMCVRKGIGKGGGKGKIACVSLLFVLAICLLINPWQKHGEEVSNGVGKQQTGKRRACLLPSRCCCCDASVEQAV